MSYYSFPKHFSKNIFRQHSHILQSSDDSSFGYVILTNGVPVLKGTTKHNVSRDTQPTFHSNT